MAVYLVAYYLKSEKHHQVLDYIKKHKWTPLSGSSYAILSDQTPLDIDRALREIVDKNDYTYVMALRRPWYGHGDPEAVNWLDANLPYN